MFISNNRTWFHLWRKKNLVKRQKVSKYCETDCSLPPKKTILSILAKDSLKIEIKLFLWCAISHEN